MAIVAWTIPTDLEAQMIDHCVAGFPLESCGLFLGPVNADGTPAGEITKIWPSTNTEQSARIYTIDPKDMFEANKYGLQNDLEIIGVYHSHTHTQAYPSPTDIKQSVDPNWCYAIVSLEREDIDIKYFHIEKDRVDVIDCAKV